MKQNIIIILASGSPRRKELLEQAGLEFQILTSEIEEKTEFTRPQDVVIDLSTQKCNAVSDIFIRKTQDTNSVDMLNMLLVESGGILVVGADTVVSLDNNILGKPVNAADAKACLMKLSGRTHEVYTGVSCKYLTYSSYAKSLVEADFFSFYSKTLVKMYPFDEYNALDYIATGEPMDKAGSYGIQGIGSRLVEKIDGDYNNVVGFPLGEFVKKLVERDYLEFG